MNSTITNKREAYRLKPEEFEDGAGIVVGRSVIPAKLVDYSIGGCALRVQAPVKLAVGDQVRVATAKGQYIGVVKRVFPVANGTCIGVQFTSTVDEKIRNKNSIHLLCSSKRSLSGNIGFGAVAAAVAAWVPVVFAFYLAFAR